MATLERIWLKRAKRGPMVAVETATLRQDRGIVGNADQGGWRQVTILQREAWESATGSLGEELDPAARRANLLVSGIDLRESRGRTLRIGACRILVRGETRPCYRMEEALPGLERALRSDWGGGVFGKIVAGGEIALGDEVAWESSQADTSSEEDTSAASTGTAG